MARQVLTVCTWVVVVEQVSEFVKSARKAQSPMVKLYLVAQLLLARPIGPYKKKNEIASRDGQGCVSRMKQD